AGSRHIRSDPCAWAVSGSARRTARPRSLRITLVRPVDLAAETTIVRGHDRAPERVTANAEAVGVRPHGLEDPGIRRRVAIGTPGGVHVDTGAVGVSPGAVGRIGQPRLGVGNAAEESGDERSSHERPHGGKEDTARRDGLAITRALAGATSGAT